MIRCMILLITVDFHFVFFSLMMGHVLSPDVVISEIDLPHTGQRLDAPYKHGNLYTSSPLRVLYRHGEHDS